MDEEATLEGQFAEFARLHDNKRDGTMLNLWRSDFWFRQARLLDDRKLTMTDTGLVWFREDKTELDWDEWHKYMCELCEYKELNVEEIEFELTNCGSPGAGLPVEVPQYRDYFKHYKKKSKTAF